MKIKEFDPQIYPRKLWVVVNPNKEQLKSQFDDVDEMMDDLDDDTWDASMFHVYDYKQRLGGVMLIFREYKHMSISNITHESVHAAMEILRYIDVKLDYDNQEPLTYLTGWVADCVHKVLLDD